MVQELVSAGLAPDVVAGTSIGAVVGASYAAGRLDSLEAFATRLNRRRVLTLIDPSLSGGSLIHGRRLERRLLRDLRGLRFEDLAIPFAAMATEMRTGHEVCLRAGDLVPAIRASYALPGIFEPERIDGRWLFDGAMSNPVPVSICRALGADFVIAVDLTAATLEPDKPDADPDDDLLDEDALEDVDLDADDDIASPVGAGSARATPDEPRRSVIRRRFQAARRRLLHRRRSGAPGIARVVVDAFSIAQERISRSRLVSDPPDALIHARLGQVGLFDFHRAVDLIAHGRASTRAALPDIRLALARVPSAGGDPWDRRHAVAM